MDSENSTSIRETIEMLTRLAAALPTGLDTPVEFGVCDGTDMRLFERVDVSEWTHFREDGSVPEPFVLFRGHLHPGSEEGRLLRAGSAVIDEAITKMLGGDEPEPEQDG